MKFNLSSQFRVEWAIQWQQKTCTSLCAMLMTGLLQVLSKPGVFVFLIVFVHLYLHSHLYLWDAHDRIATSVFKTRWYVFNIWFVLVSFLNSCYLWLSMNQKTKLGWSQFNVMSKNLFASIQGWRPPLTCQQLFHATSISKWNRWTFFLWVIFLACESENNLSEILKVKF